MSMISVIPPQHTKDEKPHEIYRSGFAIGRFIYRMRWIIITLWLILFASALPYAAKVSTVLTGSGFTFDQSESIKVANIAQNTLHYSASQVSIVFQSPTIPVTDPAYQAEVRQFIARAQSYQDVTGVVPAPAGIDGKTLLVTVNFQISVDTLEQRLERFRQIVPQGAAASPATAYVTGDAAIYEQMNQIAQTDIEKADASALPLALAVLFIVFGTLAAACMPIILASIAVPIALAIIYGIALHYTTNVSVLSIASIVGLGLSIDYSLFFIRRFREELLRGRTVQEAIAWTEATSGGAILFSGLTVVIGFTSMLFLGVPVMTSLALGGAAVVLISLLGAVTFIPALLSVIGFRINAWQIPLTKRFFKTIEDDTNATGFWHNWALKVMERPVTIIVLVSIFLLILGFPILKMTIGVPSATNLPTSSATRQGYDILAREYPQAATSPFYIIVQSQDGTGILSPSSLEYIEITTQWLSQQQHVTDVASLTHIPATGSNTLTFQQLMTMYASGAYAHIPALNNFVTANANSNTTMLTVTTDTKLDSPEGKALVETIRNHFRHADTGFAVYVGGLQAVMLDFNHYLYGNFPKAIAFILIVTFILLMMMFRSILLPLKAVVMNILSISVAYGALVWVFQWGNLAGQLGFTSDGFIETTVPIMLFCILFGLSMDYEVFLLSRIREEWLRTGDNQLSIAHGLERTAGTITSAALIMIIVAGAITFTTMIVTKEMGFGMAVAVFVDATIIRTLLVPATMRLLGKWNWWMPGLKSSQ